MGALIVQLATWLGGLSRFQFLAVKLILFVFFVNVLPVILFNFLLGFVAEHALWIAQKVTQALPSTAQTFAYNFPGTAGWIASRMNLPTALNLIISAHATRFTLSIIMGRAA